MRCSAFQEMANGNLLYDKAKAKLFQFFQNKFCPFIGLELIPPFLSIHIVSRLRLLFLNDLQCILEIEWY